MLVVQSLIEGCELEALFQHPAIAFGFVVKVALGVLEESINQKDRHTKGEEGINLCLKPKAAKGGAVDHGCDA